MADSPADSPRIVSRLERSNDIHVHELANGLVLLAENMDWLESVSFCLLLPAGCVLDPSDRLGLSNFVCEMVQRGCGKRDSRQFIEELDGLGVERSCGVSSSHTTYGAAMPYERLPAALAIYADLVRRPHLPVPQFEEGRQVCLQELRAIEDDLAQRVMLELRRCQYPSPWGRPSTGDLAGVMAAQPDDLRGFFAQHYQPRGAVLAVAGKFSWPDLRSLTESLFGDWAPQDAPQPVTGVRGETQVHLPHDSAQTQIAVGYDCVPYSHPDYYEARGAVGVLSDGMSSRLFTEVRENRGLAYSVYASCHSLRDRGSVMCYAGTSTELAQQTLDVLLHELRTLGEGIRPEELRRLKARIKSNLIMQQESSSSRAGSIAGDWFHLQSVRTLHEIGQKVDALTCDSINAYLAGNAPRDFTVVTLGSQPLEIPHGIS